MLGGMDSLAGAYSACAAGRLQYSPLMPRELRLGTMLVKLVLVKMILEMTSGNENRL